MFVFSLDTIQYQHDILASEMTFFLGIYCWTASFLGEFFDDPFLGIFFDELFLNKGGGGLGLLNFQNFCAIGLKIRHFRQKN